MESHVFAIHLEETDKDLQSLKLIKEEFIEDDKDLVFSNLFTPTIQLHEPMSIPKFMKEVRVSLQKLNESEILKHTRHTQENTDSKKRKRTPEKQTESKRRRRKVTEVQLQCKKCDAKFGSKKILDIHVKLMKHT